MLHRGAEELAILVPSPRASVTPQAPALADPNDIWAGYDPTAVKQALAESAGVLKDLDKEALLADLAAQRVQDSRGRPGDA